MKAKAWIMLRVLLSRFHSGMAAETVLKGMPQDFIQKILSQEVGSSDPSFAFKSPEELLKHVHYTWISQAFEKIPKPLHSITLSALPEPQHSGVAKMLQMQSSSKAFASPVRSFLLQKLIPALKEDKILPIEFLPKSLLNPLLELSKKELMMVIDYLALYDLSHEMRHIVDKKIIKNIYDSLSPRKQHFLRLCLHQKDKLVVPRLHLEKWNGDSETLEILLHRRGMLRLGKSLTGQHPDFMWHLVHTLDIGRGKILARYLSTEETPGISTVLIQQVLNVLNFCQKKE